MSDDELVQKFRELVGEWFSHAVLPQMTASLFVIGVITPETDPFMLMQIGAAVILEKPLILISVRGAWIPAKARRLADAVLEMESADDIKRSPEFQERLQASIREVVKKHKLEAQRQ